jgi:lipid A ethanolaminephosphotransferase
VLQQCDRQALVNAYDNSIAYTDHVLAQAIGWLGQARRHLRCVDALRVGPRRIAGRKNLYLHGLPYALAPREQTHVPMLMWFAPGTARGLQPACLQAQRDAPWSQTTCFTPSIGLAGVTAGEYKPALDVLAACRAS